MFVFKVGKRIWAKDDQLQPNRFYWFRREFHWETCDQVRIFITAESRYRLVINGIIVREGPPPAFPERQYVDQQEITKYLKHGINCLAIVVRFTGHMYGSQGGLQAELVDQNGTALIGTDSQWQACVAASWRPDTAGTWMNSYDPYQEWFDARLVPHGWDMPGFSSNWPEAQEQQKNLKNISGSYTLVDRDIPDLAEHFRLPQAISRVEECMAIEDRSRRNDLSIRLAMPGNPLKYAHVLETEKLLCEDGETCLSNSDEHIRTPMFDALYDPCILLDFGRIVTGQINLELVGVHGAVIDMGVSERLLDGYFNNAIECPFCFQYICTDGLQHWLSFTWRAFRYLRLRITNCFTPLRLRRVSVKETTYAFTRKSRVNCEDLQLNQIYQMCRDTIQLCSHESIVDTPWREQAQWLGDVAAVTLPGIYSCFGDGVMAEKFLRQSAATRQGDGMLPIITNCRQSETMGVIPDYNLWWCQAVWNHFWFTGNDSLLDELYPVVNGILERMHQQTNRHGLLVNPEGWVFLDWAKIDKPACSTVLNAIYMGAITAALKMAVSLNKKCDEEKFLDRKTRLNKHFFETFFDQRQGCFMDGIQSDCISEHANAAAILFDLCDQQTSSRLIRAMWEDDELCPVRAEPFFTSVVLRALDSAGRFDLAMQIVRDRWGKRMIARGATSTFEEWHINCSFRPGERVKPMPRSTTHAWSAYPAALMTHSLIGLKIIEPGCKTIQVQPHDIGCDYDVVCQLFSGNVRVKYMNGKSEVVASEGIDVHV